MGGSKGGGGSSGKVDFPTYMKDIHRDWLQQSNDKIVLSMTDVMNAALQYNPFCQHNAYNPQCEISSILSGLTDFRDETDLAAFHDSSSFMANLLTDEYIEDSINAFTNDLDVQVNKSRASFKAGMRNINAVMSSAFLLGDAFLLDGRNRQVAKFASELRLRHQELGLKLVEMRLTFKQALLQFQIEGSRIRAIMMKEYNELQIDLDEKESLWELEIFQHGANLLGSIGSPSGINSKKPSGIQSALGGALSGAAAGAMISGGNPIGALVGGVLGIGASLF